MVMSECRLLSSSLSFPVKIVFYYNPLKYSRVFFLSAFIYPFIFLSFSLSPSRWSLWRLIVSSSPRSTWRRRSARSTNVSWRSTAAPTTPASARPAPRPRTSPTTSSPSTTSGRRRWWAVVCLVKERPGLASDYVSLKTADEGLNLFLFPFAE